MRAAARKLARESRARQGLPEHVSDPVALARLAALVRGVEHAEHEAAA